MKLERITDSNERDFQEAMEIYVEAFPQFERMPVQLVKTRINDSDYRLIVGKDNAHVICFALLYYFKSLPIILLDYYAVHRNFRNHGIGFQLLHDLCNFLGINQNDRYLLLEVEDPNFGDNQSYRVRRIAFYKRFGIVELKDVRYYLPGFYGNDPIEMILMIYPIPVTLTSTDVQAIVKEIYLIRYKRDPKEPLLKKILDSIPSKIEFS